MSFMTKETIIHKILFTFKRKESVKPGRSWQSKRQIIYTNQRINVWYNTSTKGRIHSNGLVKYQLLLQKRNCQKNLNALFEYSYIMRHQQSSINLDFMLNNQFYKIFCIISNEFFQQAFQTNQEKSQENGIIFELHKYPIIHNSLN